jgi:hypothetical protein
VLSVVSSRTVAEATTRPPRRGPEVVACGRVGAVPERAADCRRPFALTRRSVVLSDVERGWLARLSERSTVVGARRWGQAAKEIHGWGRQAVHWRGPVPWQSYNGSTVGLVTTTAWGNTPCGVRWYSLIGYVERQVNGTWTVVTPQGGVSTFGGTTLTGTTTSGSASASNGMIWDPKPGDATKPPKPPKNDKKLGKQDPPKAAPPVPTTGTAAF